MAKEFVLLCKEFHIPLGYGTKIENNDDLTKVFGPLMRTLDTHVLQLCDDYFQITLTPTGGGGLPDPHVVAGRRGKDLRLKNGKYVSISEVDGDCTLTFSEKKK